MSVPELIIEAIKSEIKKKGEIKPMADKAFRSTLFAAIIESVRETIKLTNSTIIEESKSDLYFFIRILGLDSCIKKKTPEKLVKYISIFILRKPSDYIFEDF